jgi:catechol 2,3-dioxygenase-like lactoylglutathione lyase family enzyme
MSDVALRFDHLALPVYDASETYRFYSEVLGLPLVDALAGDDWGGKPWLMMFFGAGAQLIALCALRGARPAPRDDLPEDVWHYAFSVPSAAEQRQWMARLKAHGVAYTEEDHGRQHSIYFKDPNGIVLEVTTPASAADGVSDREAQQLVRRWIEGAGAASACGRAQEKG